MPSLSCIVVGLFEHPTNIIIAITKLANTEILVALGLADKLVAVDKYSADVEGISEELTAQKVEVKVEKRDGEYAAVTEGALGRNDKIIIDSNKAKWS